jgi:hypothetical protein
MIPMEFYASFKEFPKIIPENSKNRSCSNPSNYFPLDWFKIVRPISISGFYAIDKSSPPLKISILKKLKKA